MTARLYLTIEEVAAGSPWSIRQIRRIAERDQWRRLGTRPQKYFIEDVQASIDAQSVTRTALQLLAKELTRR